MEHKLLHRCFIKHVCKDFFEEVRPVKTLHDPTSNESIFQANLLRLMAARMEDRGP